MIAAFRRFLFAVALLAAAWAFACAKEDATQQHGTAAAGTVHERKPQIQWVDFDDGLAKARSTGKPVMIDFYTDWCVFCKKLDRETLRDPEVAKTLETEFVAIRLNAENGRAHLSYRGRSFSYAEFSRFFGVTSFPSIAFLNDKGEPITMLRGFVPASQFSVFLNYIRRECYLKNVPLQEFIARGDCG
jgi:thioredoxin-related protein